MEEQHGEDLHAATSRQAETEAQVVKKRKRPLVVNGTRIEANDGRVYVASNVIDGRQLTLTRLQPKVKGKAAVKAHKRARQNAQRHQC